MAEATKVVITTVGPYIEYGEPLVAACAAAGTALRRPHRRARVHGPDVRPPPPHGGEVGRAHRPRLRLRLDPAGPRRALHRPAAARGRADRDRGARARRRQAVGRDGRLGARDHGPLPARARRCTPAAQPRARDARAPCPRDHRAPEARRRDRPLPAADADDRSADRAPVRAGRPALRARLLLRAVHRRQAAAGGGGHGRRRQRAVRAWRSCRRRAS